MVESPRENHQGRKRDRNTISFFHPRPRHQDCHMMWRKLTLNLPSESYLFPGDTYLEVSLHGQVSVLVSGEENTQNTHAFLWYLATALGAVNKTSLELCRKYRRRTSPWANLQGMKTLSTQCPDTVAAIFSTQNKSNICCSFSQAFPALETVLKCS